MAGSTTTFTTARFLTSDYLVQGQDTPLSCPLHRSGALVVPTQAGSTVSVYDASNRAVVSAAAVTVTDNVATYAVPASVLPSSLSRGMGWRVEWSLVVAGVATTYRNSAGLVRSQLAPMVTDQDLFRRESGLDPAGPAPLSTLTDFQDKLDEAWVTIHGKLAGKGSLPHLIMEPTALRECMIFLTLHLIFEDFKTRLGEAFGEKATKNEERFEKAWGELAFEYDTTDSGQSDGRRKRSATPTLWLGGFD